jgi:SAM-dependent methyltransferase
MGVVGKAREWRWRLAGHYGPLGADFTAPLRGAVALEVGGPSGVFQPGGVLPVYGVVGRLDSCQFSAETVWHGRQDAGAYRPAGADGAEGTMFIVDGVTLAGLDDARYDAVLSSHVIEHLANPLRALRNWRRVTRLGGRLLIVAPHVSGTFDHRRPVTPLSHLIADYAADTAEDDLTHLDEVLALHDLRRDAAVRDRASFEADRRANQDNRLLHHHTFTGPSLVALLDHAGVQVDAVAVRYPHDIYCIGRWVGEDERPDNSGWLEPGAEPWRASPFAVDRRPGAYM